MPSEIRVDTITSRSGLGTATVSSDGFTIVGILTASSFSGSGANLTGIQPFASGTAILFNQAAAPTGWTKQTTHNNKALRLVSGTGGGSGGTTAFTSVFTSRTPAGSVAVSNAAFTLTTNEMPSHTHNAYAYGTITVNGPYFCPSTTASVISTTLATGSGGSHTHANTAAFTGTAMDFDVQYVDIISCTKD